MGGGQRGGESEREKKSNGEEQRGYAKRTQVYAAATAFRRELLRDLGFDGARSERGTLCQPVTSGIDGGCGEPYDPS